jgi:hypothetical protein
VVTSKIFEINSSIEQAEINNLGAKILHMRIR